jgi:hypothetical protein
MVFGTILSGCLFILPAAITTGVLVGLDAVRSGNNQKPIFTVPPGGGYGGGPGMSNPDRGNGISTDVYCDKTLGVYPYVAKDHQQYTRKFFSPLPPSKAQKSSAQAELVQVSLDRAISARSASLWLHAARGT